jgi:hypothetical protein
MLRNVIDGLDGTSVKSRTSVEYEFNLAVLEVRIMHLSYKSPTHHFHFLRAEIVKRCRSVTGGVPWPTYISTMAAYLWFALLLQPLLLTAGFLATGPPAAPPLKYLASGNEFSEAEFTKACEGKINKPSSPGGSARSFWLTDSSYEHKVCIELREIAIKCANMNHRCRTQGMGIKFSAMLPSMARLAMVPPMIGVLSSPLSSTETDAERIVMRRPLKAPSSTSRLENMPLADRFFSTTTRLLSGSQVVRDRSSSLRRSSTESP